MAMNLSPETMLTGVEEAMPHSPAEIAERLPQYEILGPLGRGGMGVVYRARQKALDREVAIKVLAGEWRGDTAFAQRFEREAKTLAQMSHPNIVTVHDFGEADGLYYIVMEYVDGVNLRDLLSDGKMEPEQALTIVPPICEALEYAHGKGVVHRDIKPENLLLDREGRVKIADFGIASLVGATTEVSGTPSYMAPEQASGSVDRRADIYALGVVLYEMLTGERPAKEVVAPSKKVEVDVKIDEMVLRALEKEPERRYQTAHEFRTTAEMVMTTPQGGAAAAGGPINCDGGKPSSLRSEQDEWKSPDSGWGWFIGKLFGITFTSPTAFKLANLSALGFLGSLGFLGYLPLPGMQVCFGLFGLAGFFGLIGVAQIMEFHVRARRRAPAREFRTTADMVMTSPPDGAVRDSNEFPRFSRTAMWGAMWAGWGLIGALFISGGSMSRLQWWEKVIAIIWTVSVVAAPIGATILGGISISQIRRSAGRRYGMGLAVFDGLLFPLLVLDGLILWLCVAVSRWCADFYANPAMQNRPDVSPAFSTQLANLLASHAEILILIGAFISLVVDFLVVRRVWHAANKPLDVDEAPLNKPFCTGRAQEHPS